MQYDYSAARRRYLPSNGVKVLFVGESAPNPHARVIRFFYHPVLRPADNLFRGLMLALYAADRHALVLTPKAQWLKRFQDDGYYLDDLCSQPVNDLPPAQRSQARRAAVTSLLTRIQSLAPRGIVICHRATYADIADVLRVRSLPVLHPEGIPFPIGNYRAQFALAVRAALA
ncbi:MAG: hypothetical protein EPO22_04975 [Dehalococcoidia bacterium]|nr:MAG: hypothetical protein EPO22_04975 [Dehalococcoidia bacterium]